MVTMEELRTKYYTQDGRDALSTRLKTIFAIYEETPESLYPLQFQMLGFPPLQLKSKEECFGHINELQQILMVIIEEDVKPNV